MILTRLSSLNLFIKIIFLFNQTIIKINTHIKLIKYNKRKKYYTWLRILEILYENKFYFSNIKFIYTKEKKI
jgi:ABC-type transport system involved in Fe-S cluster assembly fused permease/ATPase subunit